MSLTGILQHFEKVVPLTEHEKQIISDNLYILPVKRKTFLLKAGEVCKASYYVCKGCLRYYRENDKDEQYTMYFAIEDWWCGDLYSLYSGLPADSYIESLEDSEVVVLEHSKQQVLYEQVPKLERFFRILLERNIVATQALRFSRMASTAVERYHAFTKRYPDLESRISQKHIASYIGVTPEFLSKMKHDLYKGKA